MKTFLAYLLLLITAAAGINLAVSAVEAEQAYRKAQVEALFR